MKVSKLRKANKNKKDEAVWRENRGREREDKRRK